MVIIYENEAHFLFECDWYDTERNQFVNETDINLAELSTADNFQKVFEHKNRLGRYMKTALHKRKNKLYKV